MGPLPDRLDELARGGEVEAGARGGRDVGDPQLVACEPLPQPGERLVGRLVGGVPVVDGEHGRRRDHVGCDAAADPDGVQPFAVDEAVDLDLLAAVPGERLQRGREGVDGVDAHPGAGAVRGDAVGVQLDADGTLAAALDARGGGFHEDGEVCFDEVGSVPGEPPEPVARGVDLLVVVEDPGDVAVGGFQLDGERQHDRDPALHVARAASPDDVALRGLDQPRRQVVEHGDGVEVPGDDDALGPPQVGARDDAVAVAVERQVRRGLEPRLDEVRERALVPGDGLDVDDLPQQGGQLRHAPSLSRGVAP